MGQQSPTPTGQTHQYQSLRSLVRPISHLSVLISLISPLGLLVRRPHQNPMPLVYRGYTEEQHNCAGLHGRG